MSDTTRQATLPMARPAKVTCFRCREKVVGDPTILEIKSGALRNQGVMSLCGVCSLALDSFIFPTANRGA
jgi:hypothetical protein